MNFFSKYKIEIILFLIPVILSSFILWLYLLQGSAFNYPFLSFDSTEFNLLATNIINLHQFTLSSEPPFLPESFRTPGYPVFLALIKLVFNNNFFIPLTQIFLLGLCTVILFKILLSFLDNKVAFIVSLLFSIEPTVIYHSLVALSDMFFVFLLLLSIFYFVKLMENPGDWFFAVLTGVFLGLSCLVKPIGQFLPLLFLFFLLVYFYKKYNRKIILIACLLIVTFLFTVSPWLIRNYKQYGVLRISSASSYNLLAYNVTMFYAQKNHINENEAKNYLTSKLSSQDEYFLRSLSNSKSLDRVSQSYIKDNFFEYLQFHFSRIVKLFLADGSRDLARMFHLLDGNYDKSPVDFFKLIAGFKIIELIMVVCSGIVNFNLSIILWFLGLLFWLFINILAIIGAVYGMINKEKEKRWFILFCLGVIFYFAVLTGPVSTSRYRLPIEPFMFALSAFGFLFIQSLLKRGKAAIIGRSNISN
jgi:4-amino-4-deoxy-L-arabinose transferase-like glycosyltransferase